MTALRKHLISFDLPVEKWGAYFEARRVLVCALHHTIPDPVFSALICRKDNLDGDRRNLRFPINPRLENASQAIPSLTTSGVST